MFQDHFFPDRKLPALVCIFPSSVEAAKQAHSREDRLEAHYLDVLATKVYDRVMGWSNEGQLTESSKFIYQWFTFWNAMEARMPAKRGKASTQYEKQEWRGFVERTLSEDELAQADDYKLKPAELAESMCALAEAGYDIKLSYNTQHKTASATLIDQRPKLPTSGYALSARGTNCVDAYKLLLYKHTVVLAQDWTPLLAAKPRQVRG